MTLLEEALAARADRAPELDLGRARAARTTARRRRASVAAVGALGLAVAAGLGTVVALRPAPTVPATVATVREQPRTDPAGLQGTWTVVGVDGSPTLRLGPGYSPVSAAVRTLPCGDVHSDWGADDHAHLLFLGAGYFAQACGPDQPAWLTRVVGWRPDGDDQVLLDRAGEQVARLVRTARATGDPGATPSPPPLPAGLRPVDAAFLVGRWAPDADPQHRATLWFDTDGTFGDEAGCHGPGGVWTASPDGSFLSVTASSQVASLCSDDRGVEVHPVGALRVGTHGRDLVLVHPDGTRDVLHRPGEAPPVGNDLVPAAADGTRTTLHRPTTPVVGGSSADRVKG